LINYNYLKFFSGSHLFVFTRSQSSPSVRLSLAFYVTLICFRHLTFFLLQRVLVMREREKQSAKVSKLKFLSFHFPLSFCRLSQTLSLSSFSSPYSLPLSPFSIPLSPVLLPFCSCWHSQALSPSLPPSLSLSLSLSIYLSLYLSHTHIHTHTQTHTHTLTLSLSLLIYCTNFAK